MYNLGLALVDEKEDNINREYNENKLFEVIKIAKKNKFLVVVYLIVGFPWQTKNEIIKKIDLLSKLNVIVGVSIFYPIKGTKIFNDYKKNFENIKFCQMRSTGLYLETENITRQDLVDIMKYSYEKNKNCKI